MLVLLIFVKPCRLEKALVVEKRTFKESRDDMRKGKHDVFAYIIPGWGSERKIRFSSNHPGWHWCPPNPQFSLCTWPLLRER